MKTRKLESLEKEGILGTTLKSLVLSGALLGALVGSPTEGSAKTKSDMPEGETVTEVIQKSKEVKEEKKTISFEEAMQGIEDEGEYVEEGEEKPGTEPDPDSDGDGAREGVSQIPGPRITASGFIQVGTSVVPDFAEVLSDKPSMLMCVDATDTQSGFGVSLLRLDDFSSDPAYPVSRASVIVPHRSKSFGDGKRSVGASVECTFIDKLPGDYEIMPSIMGSYSADSGWTFEGEYFHEHQKGPDMDAFRLGISKKIGEALTLTTQGWYKSDYDKKVFGRVIVDVSLGDGLGAQLSCIAKDGKLTPTAGVIYEF